MKILFVCTGNTCRSAMCDGWFRHLIQRGSGKGISCFSAGISAGNTGASFHAVAVLRKYGADLSGHRSRQLTGELAAEADLILCMTEGHRSAVRTLLSPADGKKVHLLLEYDGHPGVDVPDPFGGPETVYEQCFCRMRPALEKLFEMCTNQHTLTQRKDVRL